MATMMIQLSNDCWSRWGAVIRKLAEKYSFPASNQDEMNIFLRIFAGNGSTFRLTSEPWKFIIDVTRRGNVIDDIIAITVMAKAMEDPRRNGKVVTRACVTHTHPDPSQPGAPALQWIDVTSGGESYRHCCEKECRSLEKTVKLRLSWETVRLRIIQKSYEQQVLSLNDEIRSWNTRFPTKNDLSQQILTLNQLVEENSGELAKSKESRKKWKNLAVERREKVSSLQSDIEELQDQVTTSEEMTTTTFMQELDALKQKEAHFKKEKEAFWKEKEDFDKEKRSFEVERRNPSTTPRTPRSRNNAMETRLRNLTKFNEEIEKERTSNKQSIQMKEMGDELTNLQRNIEGLELERKKHIENHQAEVQELNVTNARIHNSKRSVDHYSDLETQQKLRREADERITDLQSKLNATELEVRAKTTEIAALGRKLADKTAALDYQEKKCFDYASKLATMRSELETA
ncbi:hypothetical protein CSOJ01_15776, partial [Colletotrichum sojae]